MARSQNVHADESRFVLLSSLCGWKSDSHGVLCCRLLTPIGLSEAGQFNHIGNLLNSQWNKIRQEVGIASIAATRAVMTPRVHQRRGSMVSVQDTDA